MGLNGFAERLQRDHDAGIFFGLQEAITGNGPDRNIPDGRLMAVA